MYIFECLIMMICPYPFYDTFVDVIPIGGLGLDDTHYLLGDLCFAFMFFRMFFFYRTVINYSDYTDAYSLKVCKQYGFTSGAFFAIKVKMITNPGMLVAYDFLS